ncbi:patatin-like protein 6 [Rhodamnia argentea]|uniref:Patatin-like protein 6 n=1 Tax=Rhodamnia argentea TaxID=178133 RepID=A0A8B8NEQ1_9MYRT|nr:patatin-like protein 6 [Rhodamnia argentea]
MLFSTKDHSRPLFWEDDTWKFLADHGRKFYRSRPVSGSGGFSRRLRRGAPQLHDVATTALEKLMKESFGDGAEREPMLRNTRKPVLVPCYDLTSSAPLLFSRANALETNEFDFRLREVCQATLAEPGVLEQVRMRSVDGQTRCVAVGGALLMSNPGGAAVTHVLHNK